MNYRIIRSDELYHYGVKGMKWGVRRTQPVAVSDSHHTLETTVDKRADRKAKMKKAAKIGAAVAITALATYGAYKYGPKIVDKISKGKAIQKAVSLEQEQTRIEDIKKFFEDTRRFSGLDMEISSASQQKRDIASTINAATKRASESQGEKIIPKSSSFDPSKFKFTRNAMLRPDGGIEYIDLPVDKKGYAHEFAKAMAKDKKDYDYWNDWMYRRLTRYDG